MAAEERNAAAVLAAASLATLGKVVDAHRHWQELRQQQLLHPQGRALRRRHLARPSLTSSLNEPRRSSADGMEPFRERPTGARTETAPASATTASFEAGRKRVQSAALAEGRPLTPGEKHMAAHLHRQLSLPWLHTNQVRAHFLRPGTVPTPPPEDRSNGTVPTAVSPRSTPLPTSKTPHPGLQSQPPTRSKPIKSTTDPPAETVPPLSNGAGNPGASIFKGPSGGGPEPLDGRLFVLAVHCVLPKSCPAL